MRIGPGFKDWFLLLLVWMGGVLLYGIQLAWFGAARLGERSLGWGRRLIR